MFVNVVETVIVLPPAVGRKLHVSVPNVTLFPLPESITVP
jgi:hypothetical protein